MCIGGVGRACTIVAGVEEASKQAKALAIERRSANPNCYSSAPEMASQILLP